MSSPAIRRASIADWRAIPEAQRHHELIDGVLVEKDAASGRHGRAQLRLDRNEVGHYWIVDPLEQTLAVHRWHPDGYVEVLAADRDERVRAEPFDALEIRVGALFDDDDE